jgi:hypothetical protein
MQLLSKTPKIVNTTLASANTEYSFTLPQSTKKFTIQGQDDNLLKISFTEGQSGTTYFSIFDGASHSEDNLNVSGGGLTIYVQSPDAGAIVECLYWRTV